VVTDGGWLANTHFTRDLNKTATAVPLGPQVVGGSGPVCIAAIGWLVDHLGG